MDRLRLVVRQQHGRDRHPAAAGRCGGNELHPIACGHRHIQHNLIGSGKRRQQAHPIRRELSGTAEQGGITRIAAVVHHHLSGKGIGRRGLEGDHRRHRSAGHSVLIRVGAGLGHRDKSGVHLYGLQYVARRRSHRDGHGIPGLGRHSVGIYGGDGAYTGAQRSIGHGRRTGIGRSAHLCYHKGRQIFVIVGIHSVHISHIDLRVFVGHEEVGSVHSPALAQGREGNGRGRRIGDDIHHRRLPCRYAADGQVYLIAGVESGDAATVGAGALRSCGQGGGAIGIVKGGLQICGIRALVKGHIHRHRRIGHMKGDLIRSGIPIAHWGPCGVLHPDRGQMMAGIRVDRHRHPVIGVDPCHRLASHRSDYIRRYAGLALIKELGIVPGHTRGTIDVQRPTQDPVVRPAPLKVDVHRTIGVGHDKVQRLTCKDAGNDIGHTQTGRRDLNLGNIISIVGMGVYPQPGARNRRDGVGSVGREAGVASNRGRRHPCRRPQDNIGHMADGISLTEVDLYSSGTVGHGEAHQPAAGGKSPGSRQGHRCDSTVGGIGDIIHCIPRFGCDLYRYRIVLNGVSPQGGNGIFIALRRTSGHAIDHQFRRTGVALGLPGQTIGRQGQAVGPVRGQGIHKFHIHVHIACGHMELAVPFPAGLGPGHHGAAPVHIHSDVSAGVGCGCGGK